MKRFSPGLAAPAFVVILAPFLGCIPDPDTSGLPPYDGGAAHDSPSAVLTDSSVDATLNQDAGADVGAADSAPGLGTVSGIVIDYTQGNGKGVVAGAKVSVSVPGSPSASVPPQVITDAYGLFTIPKVPAGPVQIYVSKPTDLTNGIAYSTSSLVTTVGAGETVNVAPVLHEGCFQNFALNPGADAGNLPVTLLNATCPGGGRRPGAYAAMTFEPTSFKDPASTVGGPWGGSIRVEMIPLAYPLTSGGVPDFSWARGLPGITTPLGLLGAAEYRVVKLDPGQPGDGQALPLLNPVKYPVTIAVPIFTSPAAATHAYSYDTASASWTAESSSPPSAVQDAGPPLEYVSIQVPRLSWWAATDGVPAPTSTTCVKGKLQGGGNALPNVLVRAAGSNYLGSSSGQTDSLGLFCLDVPAAAAGADGGAAQIELVANGLVGGVPYAGSTTFAVTSLGGGSCVPSGADASSPPSCTVLPQIELPQALTCVSGNVVFDGGALSTLTATLVQIPVTPSAVNAGIQSTAYVGLVPLTNGSFCALAPPGNNLRLLDPDSGCGAPNSLTQGSIPVLNGSSAPSCAAGGCSDAGGIPFGCGGG